ncbi:MAG: hypothetical protein RR365_00765 [Bacteroides sp.]
MKPKRIRRQPWQRQPHPEDCRHIWMSGICVKCGVAIGDVSRTEGKVPIPYCKP